MSMPHSSSDAANEASTESSWLTNARKQLIADRVDWTVSYYTFNHYWKYIASQNNPEGLTTLCQSRLIKYIMTYR